MQNEMGATPLCIFQYSICNNPCAVKLPPRARFALRRKSFPAEKGPGLRLKIPEWELLCGTFGRPEC